MLVRLLCAISLLSEAQASQAGRDPPLLTQNQLEEPARVAQWLKLHANRADLKRAAVAHEEGVRDQARHYLAPALKGYGESALWFPSPQAIITYTDLAVRYYGDLRKARKDHAQFQAIDLRRFEALYRSALAADDVLVSLNARERGTIAAKAACLERYRLEGTGLQSCAPLQMYGARQ